MIGDTLAVKIELLKEGYGINTGAGNQVVVDKDEMPQISVATKEVFKKFGTEADKYLTYPLKDKVENLETLTLKLQESKNNEVSDKLLGVLRSALTTAVLVGGIIGMVALAANPIGFTLLMVSTILSYFISVCYNGDRAGLDMVHNDAQIAFSFFASPFLPLYENFGKITRQENGIKGQKQEIEANIQKLAEFFKHDRSGLETALEEKVEKSQKTVDHLNAQEGFLSAKKEAEKELTKYKNALDQFQKAKAFFAKLRESESTLSK